MADNNDTLIRELKAEMERERFETLWKKYGSYLFALAAAIVVTVAGYQYWQVTSKANAEAAGARYEEALVAYNAKKLDEAQKAWSEIAKDGPSGYAALSRLQLAGLHLEKGEKKQALAIYDDLTKQSGVDPLLSSFAKLQSAAARVDEADFTDTQNRLNALTDDDNPWRFSARELIAVAALKAGKRDEARKALEALMADGNAPPSVRERVQLMMAKVVVGDIAAENANTPAKEDEKAGESGSESADTKPAKSE